MTVRHFLIRPVPAYGKYTTQSVETYIKRHASKFRVDEIAEDPIIEQVIREAINIAQNGQRSNLRKAIFASVTGKESLDHFATRMINDWHMGKQPSDTSKKSITAQLALAREVAAPLAKAKNQRGADTGFWKKINEKLKALHGKHGVVQGRSSPGWHEWEEDVIHKDIEIYGNSRAGASSLGIDDEDGYDMMYNTLGDDLEADPLLE
ncbi:hypothetical protein PHLCEN_2v3109 [Hermanssonia centrifuga]|uniref:Uncharacterized protein n=1 Tax=Hermanssonia centrifuga TaxID=98765 RepID=A0A2R6R3X8_9APHY|nr:hypothetical protein PHLCEN_2v3109 [Hermanssonia centrifuga]